MSVDNNCVLIFVNPSSGVGQARHIFEHMLSPRLKAASMSYDCIITGYTNHAKTFISECTCLQKYNSVVILSGDGLIFEVLNGILERRDRKYFLAHMPIGIIPVGSGNGLLASVFSHLNRNDTDVNKFVKHAMSAICDSKTTSLPVNLLHIETSTASFAAFLSVGYGLLSDIDIESERWRKIFGRARFTIGALIRCFLGLRVYRCRVSFLKSSDAPCKSHNLNPLMAVDAITSSLAAEYSANPNPTECLINSSSNEFLQSMHICDGIPKISEPVPPQWTVIEDEFIFIYAVALSHIGHNAIYMPDAKLNDENIYLTYALSKEVNSKVELFKFLIDINNGEHLKYPFFKTERVRSLRIESMSKSDGDGGIFAVDGELINSSKLQVTVTSSTMAVIAS
uniref:DAGKc domain-containing protein n=1 Tax=Parascaris univalens TaxID=6257 RepID=A0A915BDJ5_PARUN